MSGPMLSMIFLVLLCSCDRNMRYQDSYRAWEKTMLPPMHTVPLEEEQKNEFIVTKDFLKKGQGVYERNCSMCHGLSGDGKGFVTTRGLTPPPSFHESHLFTSPPSHFVEIIRNGKGRMPSYQRRLTFEEQWMAAHYIKVLQLAKKFPVEKLSAEDKRRLE